MPTTWSSPAPAFVLFCTNFWVILQRLWVLFYFAPRHKVFCVYAKGVWGQGKRLIRCLVTLVLMGSYPYRKLRLPC